ncbi:MAG: hypothetical protein U9O49_00245 [Candidatus Thermoplasmatota archaeon]|nr:hypothetical protein [Candidatus Thermoplasmatota archaeon]
MQYLKMDEEEINYRVLRRIQQTEKASPAISNIHSDFYGDLQNYISSIKERLSNEDSENKQKLLIDEIKNTKKIATSIYEQREKKILLAATSKTRGGNPNLKNLTPIERNLFDSVLELMIKSRIKVFEGDENNSLEKGMTETEKTTEGNIENNPEGNRIISNKNPIVTVIKDMPEFVGTDTKNYNLKKGDALSIPKDMEEMLSKRNIVKEIKSRT